MHPTLSFIRSHYLVFALPLLVILSSVFIVESGVFWQDPGALAMGITYDLALTSPLLYLFLIRNKPIPKTTAVPFFIGGLLIASFLLPEEFQFHLDLLKTYVLPAVELGILLALVIKARKTIQRFRETPHQQDFLSQLRHAAVETTGSSLVGNVLTSEVALFYYGLFSWKKTPAPGNHTFSYHRKSGTPALYAVVILILLVETIALHFLLGLWSPVAAWILTLSSVYATLQVLAHLKACRQRPVILEEDKLIIRFGLMGDTEIPFNSIERIITTNNYKGKKKATQLAFLKGIEPYNLVVELKEPLALKGMYGIRTTFQTLLLFIDQKETFLETLQIHIAEELS